MSVLKIFCEHYESYALNTENSSTKFANNTFSKI